MDIQNHLLYFVSQSYKQVQLSATKGGDPYPYSAFAGQFSQLLDALGNEDQARQLTTQLIEETATRNQSVDYLRQRMTDAAQPARPGKQAESVEANTVLV